MEPTYASADEVGDVIEGAVIERLEFRDGGARMFLRDGRTILIPGAETFFICSSKTILQ